MLCYRFSYVFEIVSCFTLFQHLQINITILKITAADWVWNYIKISSSSLKTYQFFSCWPTIDLLVIFQWKNSLGNIAWHVQSQEQCLTVMSIQTFSLIAPQQPKNPKTIIIHPQTMKTIGPRNTYCSSRHS